MRASSLPLLTKCSGSAYLPRDDTKSENAEEAAIWGKMVHHWKETGKIEGPTARIRNALQSAIKRSGADRAVLWPEGTHETAVAVRIDGNRAVQSGELTEESTEWLTGHDDFHYWFADGTLWVDDLKTGKEYPHPETGANRFPQDVRSAQLKLYALAVATLYEYTGTIEVSITHWPRLPLSSRHSLPNRIWTTYSYGELLSFWSELETLYTEVEAGKQGVYTLRPGDHCRFCPSKIFCLEAAPDAPAFEWRNQ